MLRVDFPRIHLADASHPASNKGYIMYEVNAKEGLVIGDEIRNTADIYFDINPAIVTNTTVNVIPEPQSIEPITPTDGIHIFPNPATGTVSIDNKNAAFHSIKMVNTLGQVLQTSPLQSGLNTLNIDAMAKGVYYLILESKDGIKASKLIKK